MNRILEAIKKWKKGIIVTTKTYGRGVDFKFHPEASETHIIISYVEYDPSNLK